MATCARKGCENLVPEPVGVYQRKYCSRECAQIVIRKASQRFIHPRRTITDENRTLSEEQINKIAESVERREGSQMDPGSTLGDWNLPSPSLSKMMMGATKKKVGIPKKEEILCKNCWKRFIPRGGGGSKYCMDCKEEVMARHRDKTKIKRRKNEHKTTHIQ
jgi:hypothetical protein